MEHHVDYRVQLSAALEALDLTTVSRIRGLLAQAREDGRQVFLCGNGGSAATASHMANDLGKGASCGKDKRFKVIALRYCQMLWMKVVCPWRDGAAEESVSGRPWLISMRLF